MDPTTDRAAEQAAVPTRTFHAVVTRCERWADLAEPLRGFSARAINEQRTTPQYRHTLTAGRDLEINVTLDAPLAIDAAVDVTIAAPPAKWAPHDAALTSPALTDAFGRRTVLAGTHLDTCTSEVER